MHPQNYLGNAIISLARGNIVVGIVLHYSWLCPHQNILQRPVLEVD